MVLHNKSLFKSNKAQVTLFIIIAVVILVIFSVFMIILSGLGSKKIDTGRTAIIETDASYGEFNSFFEACLANALDDGIYLLGRQGGFIFKDQQGSLLDFDIETEELDGSNVTVVTEFNFPSYMLPSPGYPCLNQNADGWPLNLRGNTCIGNFNHAMLNINALSFGSYKKYAPLRDVEVSLCKNELFFNHTQYDSAISQWSDEYLQSICKPSPFTAKRKYSIESQLTSFIESQLEDCYLESLNFFNESDVKVTDRGDFNISLSFTDTSTLASVVFPITLDFLKSDAVAEEMSFFAKSDVRLKVIYSLLYGGNILLKNVNKNLFVYNEDGIIDHDINNLTYDVESDSSELMNQFGIFNVTISRIHDNEGSLIQVIDHLSLSKGQPFIYNIRTENRPPALDSYHGAGMNEYEAYAFVGDDLFFSPVAYDPDDEGKEGAELLYDYEILDDDWRWRQDFLMNNSLYLNGLDENSLCIHPKYGMTRNRCSYLKLNESDVGIHRLKIIVTDSFGAQDSEIIDIFIDQEPNLTFKISHIYDTLPLSFTAGGKLRYIVSKEDPFILNATGSVPSGIPGVSTIWLSWEDRYNTNMDIEPNTVENYFESNYPYKFSFNSPIIVHPGYYNYTEYNILEEYIKKSKTFTDNVVSSNLDNDAVKNYMSQLHHYIVIFNQSQKQGYPLSLTNRYSSIELSYFKDGVLEQATSRDIYGADCIPYRSDVPSYPYNSLISNKENRSLNGYFSNHTCCAGDINNPLTWNIKSSGECYNSFEIGKYSDFMQEDSTNISNNLFTSLDDDYDVFNVNYYSGGVLEPQDDLVDRYIRELKGECAGSRGNVCNPTSFKIMKIPYCGQRNPSGDFNFNYTVEDTFVYMSNPESQGYAETDLCVCKDVSGTVILNRTKTGEKELYCCSDDEGVPASLSDKPCVLQQCLQYDASTDPGWSAKKVWQTPFYDPRKPDPYCYCSYSDPVVDTNDPAVRNKYCCSSDGLGFSLKDTVADCQS
ncbi:hypothetical protein H6503_01700 [Candidatus Woesearchaeota archaeon]|nr:hypothetical protein [Candidatus Woesearchaeota archaeon]